MGWVHGGQGFVVVVLLPFPLLIPLSPRGPPIIVIRAVSLCLSLTNRSLHTCCMGVGTYCLALWCNTVSCTQLCYCSSRGWPPVCACSHYNAKQNTTHHITSHANKQHISISTLVCQHLPTLFAAWCLPLVLPPHLLSAVARRCAWWASRGCWRLVVAGRSSTTRWPPCSRSPTTSRAPLGPATPRRWPWTFWTSACR